MNNVTSDPNNESNPKGSKITDDYFKCDIKGVTGEKDLKIFEEIIHENEEGLMTECVMVWM